MVVVGTVGVTLYRNQSSVVRDILESERSGCLRIYRNIADTWIQVGQDIEGEAADDLSGRSVALSSDGSPSPLVPGDMLATIAAKRSTAIEDDAMATVPHTEVSGW